MVEKFVRDNKMAIGAAGAVLLAAGAYYYTQSESTPKDPSESWLKDPEHGKNFYLTQDEAVARSNNVSDVKYKLVMALVKGGDSFLGNVVINFNLKEKTKSKAEDGCLFIDYKGRNIRSLKVNGSPVTDKSTFAK